MKTAAPLLLPVLALAASLLPAAARADDPAPARPWPHPIPCRVRDGANPDLFVMTLGDVETPLADGVFDPAEDRVTLRDGTAKEHYYRDTLGVKFYRPIDKSRFPRPPSGWCTWYYYYNRISADEVQRNADWIASNLKDYGAQVVQIDDGWQGTGEKGSARNWDALNAKNFPEGLAATAAHIKGLGLTPGLWIAPHGQNNDAAVRARPGVFLQKPDGTTASDTWEGRFLVDPTHPDTPAYLDGLFRRLVDWGFDYFKIDGQPLVVEEYGKRKEFMHAPADDPAGLYRRTLGTIRQAIGPDRYLLGCWGLPIEGAGIMDGSRTGGDIVLGWGGFQVALQPTLQHYYLHNIVWYTDPDVLLVRSPLPLEQARAWATLQGLTGQALMSSDRLPDLGEERVELLRRVYPATDIRPLDLFPTERYKRVWDLKVNHLGRRYDVVGVFNFDPDRADQVYLNWQELGLPAGRPVHVFDFWNKEYLGAWEDGLAVPSAAAGCRVLTLVPDSGRIELVSTSRHLTQGPVELARLDRSEADDRFTGTSRLVGDDPYRLSFAFPRGEARAVTYAVARAGGEEVLVKIYNHQGWAALEITSPRTQDVDWEVRFGPGEGYDFPPSAPVGLSARRVGLDGAELHWQEQYYLNAGYRVTLDGRALGTTPEARFPVRGLDPRAPHVAQVRSVWENGHESPPGKELRFTLAALVPDELGLDELTPARTSGRWDGDEIEGLPAAPALSVAGQPFAHGLSALAGAAYEYDLHGLFESFTARAGVDDLSKSEAGAAFVVLGDGAELWRSDSAIPRGGAPQTFTVRVAGVKKLTLKTIPAADGKAAAQADWLEPRLTKAKQPQP